MLEDFMEALKPGKKSGAWHMAKCPNHDDRTESLGFKEDDDGTIIMHCHAGCKNKEIMERINLPMSAFYPPKTAEEKKAWAKSQSNVEKKLPKRLGKLLDTYSYVDKDDEEVFQVLRYEGKEFRQRAANGDWSTKDLDKPLYHLPGLLAAIEGGKQVFFVEGEKDVHTLEKNGLRATTNPGGSSVRFPKKYAKILNKASVICIPDNDAPGRAHMKKVSSSLKNACILELPGVKEKGDVTDWFEQGGTKESLMALAVTVLKERKKQPKEIQHDPNQDHFVSLGHIDSKSHYFLSNQTGQVVRIAQQNLKKLNLLILAPMTYWGVKFPADKSVDWDMAANTLTQASCKRGIYNPDNERGRGAWLDDGRTILHTGKELIVDGERMSVTNNNLKTGYVYNYCESMDVMNVPPLSDEDGMRLTEILERLPFESQMGPTLLAGWIALAPICGALRWRPHLWLTGPSGSGKTWILEHVISTMLGATALYVQSSTTEAGVRQLIGRDGRPIIFDEAEMEDARSAANIQRILELARQASADSGGIIAKGTPDGHAQIYSIRSMFMMSSVTVALNRRADETRFTVIQLERPRHQDAEATLRFAETEKMARKLLTPEYSAALIARMVRLAPVVRKNALTFAIAAAAGTTTRRMGDQIGTLLAGNWALWTDKEISLEEASEYIDRIDFEALVPDEGSSEEARAWAHLQEQTVPVEKDGARVDRSIGELLECTKGRGDIQMAVADATLQRNGIRAHIDGILVSTAHSGVRELFRGTPWGIGWANVLRRVPGAEASRKNYRFQGSVPGKVTIIPWETTEESEI